MLSVGLVLYLSSSSSFSLSEYSVVAFSVARVEYGTAVLYVICCCGRSHKYGATIQVLCDGVAVRIKHCGAFLFVVCEVRCVSQSFRATRAQRSTTTTTIAASRVTVVTIVVWCVVPFRSVRRASGSS